MSGFTVVPESMGPIAGQLRDAATTLQAAWNPVSQQTASVHFGRGDDPLSPLIQAALESIGSIVGDCVSTCVGSLGDYADGLDAMASTFSTVEHDTHAMFRS